MQNSSGYGIILIIVVAALSLVAGLVVVVATSSESIRLASLQQITAHPSTSTTSPVPLASIAASESPTAATTLVQTATNQPTRSAQTNTPIPSETPTVTATASGTPVPTLAPDAIALGKISTINNSTARLRSAAGLDGKVISAVQAGEYVQILGGVTTVDEIDWVPVRINSGLNGWISADLVETLSTATP